MINIEKHSKIYTIKSMLSEKGIACQNNLSFARLTTIGCGGSIALVVYPVSIEQLQFTLFAVRNFDVPYIVLGRGSNVLASESDFFGVVIATARLNGYSLCNDGIWVSCGTSTVAISRLLLGNSWGGGEFLHCLPATIGGAVVMNAGCFGENIADIVVAVRYIDNVGVLREADVQECAFRYRGSIFKDNPLFTVAEILIKKKPVNYDVVEKCQQLFAQKSFSQPLAEKSFGCAFYGDGFSASRLIDIAGLKGCRIGGAKISEKHAGFVINVDKAKAQDIYLLLTHIKDVIRQKFRCELNTEVCMLGARWENSNDFRRLSYTYT